MSAGAVHCAETIAVRIDGMLLSDDLTRDYAAATEEAVYVHRAAPGVLRLVGDDAAEFLQGQVTNDIEGLEVGEGAYAALLTPKGKMRADMHVLRVEDALLVVCSQELLPVIRHTIDTFRIGYFFVVEDLTGAVERVSVVGPSARGAVGVEDLPVAEGSCVAVEFGGEKGTVFVGSAGVLELLVPSRAAESLLADLGGSIAVGSEELLDLLRVEAGVPAFGREVGEDNIPGEAGLNDRAVNFEKGCYVGQETVARMHYKGKPNRYLRGLVAEAPLESGAAVIGADDRELGVVGTAVVSPRLGPIALAVLRREAEPGDTVAIGDLSARVVDPTDLAA